MKKTRKYLGLIVLALTSIQAQAIEVHPVCRCKTAGFPDATQVLGHFQSKSPSDEKIGHAIQLGKTACKPELLNQSASRTQYVSCDFDHLVVKP